jgi:hypothetical protein
MVGRVAHVGEAREQSVAKHRTLLFSAAAFANASASC